MLLDKFYFILIGSLLLSSNLQSSPPKTLELNTEWKFRKVGDTKWLVATVPGTVHTDLMANGIIADPYYRLNERDQQWIDKEDWEYMTTFQIKREFLENQQIYIEFLGLDTYAKVFLNDSLVIATDNMFRRYELDAKPYLKKGENTLLIIFESPIKKGLEKYNDLSFTIPVSDNDQAETGQVEGQKKVSVFTRKAGYHFGWDWGPRLVTSGIWRPIFLKARNGIHIKDLYIKQLALNENASMQAILEIEATQKDPNTEINIIIDGKNVNQSNIKLETGQQLYVIPFQIEHPELWWPNGMGDQKLYNIEVVVKSKDAIQKEQKRIGIREITLITEPDQYGNSFHFEVNGMPVFMKGANYIPQDVFLPRVTKKRYERLIQDAVDTHMNMLRIWGGGIYEDDYFYDLCDEKGILVWQDFMFACAMFPGDNAFLENVRDEAVDNIKRLRNHPSIALWCGNNEILAAWEGWGWKQTVAKEQSKEIADTIWKAYQDIFHDILPAAVKEHNANRPYWASSPSSAPGIKESLTSGDMHYWGVWWGKEPFSKYQEVMPRFMSEFGFQSFPEFSTVQKYTTPEDYNIYSEVMKAHQRSSIGNITIEEYMLRHYRQPKDFESYLYVSHLLQAHGIKEGIEAHRRNMGYCMGSLYWQINDCWPVASWSSTDYYGKWKALHYAVKDAFSPVLLSFGETENALNLHVVSDALEDFNGDVQIQIMDFTGEVIEQIDKKILVKANSATKVIEWENEMLKKYTKENILLKARLNKEGKTLTQNIRYLLPFKDLSLPAPHLKYEVYEEPNFFSIVLKAENLAKNVYLSAGSKHNFSDNYFDILPGQKYLVRIKKDGPLKDFVKRFSIITLADTYE